MTATVTVPAWVLLYACRYAMGRATYASSQTAEVALDHADDLAEWADTLVRDIDTLRPHPMQVHEDLRGWQALADRLRPHTIKENL